MQPLSEAPVSWEVKGRPSHVCWKTSSRSTGLRTPCSHPRGPRQPGGGERSDRSLSWTSEVSPRHPPTLASTGSSGRPGGQRSPRRASSRPTGQRPHCSHPRGPRQPGSLSWTSEVSPPATHPHLRRVALLTALEVKGRQEEPPAPVPRVRGHPAAIAEVKGDLEEPVQRLPLAQDFLEVKGRQSHSSSDRSGHPEGRRSPRSASTIPEVQGDLV